MWPSLECIRISNPHVTRWITSPFLIIIVVLLHESNSFSKRMKIILSFTEDKLNITFLDLVVIE
jgi:hypothetical protein